jgi:glutamate transport system substrate-binding protein
MVVGALCLVLLACGGWITWAQQNEWDPENSDTFQKAQGRGKFVIGVKRDQPGLSEGTGTDPGNWTGFDVEIAKLIHLHPDLKDLRLEFKEMSSENREQEIKAGNVDLIVGSYSINLDREKFIDFAGPYFTTSLGVLMYEYEPGNFLVKNQQGSGSWDTKGIKGWSDVKEVARSKEYKKSFRACTAAGSTSVDQLNKAHIEYEPVTDYKKCADDLKEQAGEYSALITDRAVLVGFQNARLKMIADPIPDSTQNWGVGLKKGDKTMRHMVCEVLQDMVKGKKNSKWSDLRNKYLFKLKNEGETAPDMNKCDDV